MNPLLLFVALLNFNMAEQSYLGVQLATSGKDSLTGKTLYNSGYGLTTKRIGVVHVKIAINQVFLETPEALVRTNDGVSASLNSVGDIVMRVTFLRSVDSNLIKSNIDNAISENISSEEYPTYKEDIDMVSNVLLSEGFINARSSITFVVHPKGQTVDYENSRGSVYSLKYKAKGFAQKLMGVWFGNQATEEGIHLKNELLQEPHLTPESLNKPLHLRLIGGEL